MLKSIKNFIPNLLTLINLTFGCVGIVLAFSTELHWAGVMVFVASIFDYFDGFAARMLNAQSAVGKELDSLADLVAFGVLPGVIAFQLLRGLLGIYFTPLLDTDPQLLLMAGAGFLLTACAAYRLAVFNIDTRQSENFIGLPTPAMAIFIASFPVIGEWQLHYNLYVPINDLMIENLIQSRFIDSFEAGILGVLQSYTFWLVVILGFSYLMVSQVPIVSLKIKSLAWDKNKWRFIFIGTVLLTALLFFSNYLFRFRDIPDLQFWVIPVAILELVVVSLIRWVLDRSN